ncbi:HlyD family efflux transporter periplasmic adaptor subunit [Sphingobacterium sp.]|uniref:HlyD family secretion protein n=1 Tax=Sphingobacterium sp. TaxID=341027 RepID=UPI00289E0B9B|nr:HlyD family efflux transporter periplasmic adaptor subunit [Sphingobacterium sp.]
MSGNNYLKEDLHTEDLQEIISKPPSWLLKRGIGFVFLTIMIIIGLAFFIKYPEMIKTELKFNTAEAPKVIISKTDGHIVRLLVKDESWVEAQSNLAYLESTADHDQVLMILDTLLQFRKNILNLGNLETILSPNKLNLGELQNSYHNFFLAYIDYLAAHKGGGMIKRRNLVLDEISNINKQKKHIKETYLLQTQELKLAEIEFEKYKLLAEKKIISPMELQQKEALLLVKRQAVPQMENTLISNEGNMLSKDKELSEIDNKVLEEEKKIIQALNSFISEGENWKKKYIVSAPIAGKLIYSSFLQVNQLIKNGEELFYINPDNESYYGATFIPQINSSKVIKGQDVLIKVRSYPHSEFGYLRGKVSYISDIPIRDSVFFAKINLIRTDRDSLIKLKPGIYADAEIITEDLSVFKRIWSNIIKSMTF